jgi:hypothetical protein
MYYVFLNVLLQIKRNTRKILYLNLFLLLFTDFHSEKDYSVLSMYNFL